MDTYTHVTMYKLSTYFGVNIVAVNCEKYSLKSENLGEKSKFPVFYIYFFQSTTSITLYLTLPTDMNGYASICSPCNYT